MRKVKAMPTHSVTNQPPPLEQYNLFETDVALVEALDREAPGAVFEDARTIGRLAGSPDIIQLGFDANENRPN